MQIFNVFRFKKVRMDDENTKQTEENLYLSNEALLRTLAKIDKEVISKFLNRKTQEEHKRYASMKPKMIVTRVDGKQKPKSQLSE